MKPFDILDALSDLPEEYAAFAVQKQASVPNTETEQIKQNPQGGIVMNNAKAVKQSKSAVHISKLSIAAVVALCIGLNGALIYGISRMKKDSDVTTPGMAGMTSDIQDMSQMMELSDVMPTAVSFVIRNDTGAELPYNPQYAVMQDGNKIEDTELPSGVSYAQNPLPGGENTQLLAFAELHPGSYTLVNLAEDGETEGVLGHLDFEVSEEFDNMLWIPNVVDMDFSEAKALLEAKGMIVNEIQKTWADTQQVRIGAVAEMHVPHEKEGSFHWDGTGFWVTPGDTVDLVTVKAEAVTVSDVRGWDYLTAKNLLESLGLNIDMRYEASDTVEEGRIIRVLAEDGTELTGPVEVNVGEHLMLVVSSGSELNSETPPEGLIVPSFIAMSREAAEEAAEEMGIKIEIRKAEGAPEDAKWITAQNIEPGWKITPQTPVVLTIGTDSAETTE